MYASKSFCNISAFASNEPGIDSPIGELTSQAATFSREKAMFHHSTIEGYDLVNFYSKEDDVKEVMRRSAVDQAIAFVDLCTLTTLGTSGELYQDEVHRALVQLAETIQANTVLTGPMISDGNDHWVPRWISWHDASDPSENEHIVWLSVDDFMQDYPDFEIIVVPPVDNLDSFFNPGSIVQSMVAGITPTQMMERCEEAKQGKPETIRRTDAYTYHDPVNTTRKLEVYWSVLIYADAGNDPDLIRDALVDYILANSSHSRDDWATIFPDIFKRTEFVFVPFWDKMAVEQSVMLHGIYSPIIDNADTVRYAKAGVVGYPTTHVQANAQAMSMLYRSLQVAVIGHIENRDGNVKINSLYPDYISVPTTSTDFGRMSVTTQQWIQALTELVVLAESWSIASRLPRGVYRVIRGDRTYIARTIDRVLMLVLVKNNFDLIIGE